MSVHIEEVTGVTENLTYLRLGNWELTRTWCHCKVCDSFEKMEGTKSLGRYFIKHRCPNQLVNKDDNSNRYLYADIGKVCKRCNEAPSDEIQALYVLVTGDMET